MPDKRAKDKYGFSGFLKGQVVPPTHQLPTNIFIPPQVPRQQKDIDFEKAMMGGQVISNDDIETEWAELEEELLGG